MYRNFFPPSSFIFFVAALAIVIISYQIHFYDAFIVIGFYFIEPKSYTEMRLELPSGIMYRNCYKSPKKNEIWCSFASFERCYQT